MATPDLPESAPSQPVQLYSQPGCQPCRMTKMYLDRNNIPYVVFDVTEDEDAAQQLRDLGYNQTPVVRLDDATHWSGLRPDLLNAIPRQAAA